MLNRVELLGIVNVTRDSFSDGGRYVDENAAVSHAEALLHDGADIIDIGGESTHPDAEQVTVDEELARVMPVTARLAAAGVRVSVDTVKSEVMAAAIAAGAEFINDVRGFTDAAAIAAVAPSAAKLIVMHASRLPVDGDSPAFEAADGRARREDLSPDEVMDRIGRFFADRLERLEAAGVARERVILDPGMGFFLSNDPAASATVLRRLGEFQRFGCPLLVSTSRKSFLGAIAARDGEPRPVDERGVATVISELAAIEAGAAYIRTHDPRALRDALAVRNAIADA